MSARALGLYALLLVSTAAEAGKPFDIHGLIVGNEGARYVKGVPTLDLQQRLGAVQLRSFGFMNNRPMFAIAFYNAGQEPVNIGPENIHVTSNGQPLTVFTVEELQRQAKNDAFWNKFALAMAGGFGAAAAASQRNTYTSTMSTPYGTYRYSSSYPSIYGQIQANQITTDTAYGMAAIQYQLDATLERLDDHVVQRTTIDPGQSYAGRIILDKLKKGDPPFELRFDVDWNGERYSFAYVMQKPGRAVPTQYANMLAANAKPKVFEARFDPKTGQQAVPVAAAAVSQAPAARSNRMPTRGAIVLRSGAVKIPAKTPSGYCIKAPENYQATGSKDFPVINAYLPRCTEYVE
jgi:hypothetical protein